MLLGGFDQTIVGWNLSAETDLPIFTLAGHMGTGEGNRWSRRCVCGGIG